VVVLQCWRVGANPATNNLIIEEVGNEQQQRW
jgi:hypothetical protein